MTMSTVKEDSELDLHYIIIIIIIIIMLHHKRDRDGEFIFCQVKQTMTTNITRNTAIVCQRRTPIYASRCRVITLSKLFTLMVLRPTQPSIPSG